MWVHSAQISAELLRAGLLARAGPLPLLRRALLVRAGELPLLRDAPVERPLDRVFVWAIGPTSLVYLPHCNFSLRCTKRLTQLTDFQPCRKRVPKRAIQSARSITARTSSSVRAPGVFAAMSPRWATPSMIRGRSASVTPSSPRRVHAWRAAASALDVCRRAPRRGGRSPRRARLHEPHEVRQHHRVRLRVRRAGNAHDRLADGVVDGEAGDAAGVAGQQRAERERRCGRGSPGVEALGDQLRRAQRRLLGDRVRQRRVERLDRVRERVHRARGEVGHRLGGHQRRVGDHERRAARAATRRRRPACGGRASSRRPTASSGSRRTAARPRRAIAFAASITRPPPSATSGRPPTPSRTAAAASGTGPAGTSQHDRRRPRERRRRGGRAPVVSSA